MIQLSPQITVPVTSTGVVGNSESPDIGADQQNAVKEKGDENTFSKLLAGLLKKIKTASGTEAGTEKSQEGIALEKASHLSELKVQKLDDETNENEGLAVLFAHREGVTQDYLPRKSELSLGNEETAAAEKIFSEIGEMDPKRLGERVLAKMDGDSRNDKSVQAGAFVEVPDIELDDVTLSDISSNETDQTSGSFEQSLGFVDALAAEIGKSSPDESVAAEHLFNKQAQPAFVEAHSSLEEAVNADSELPADGKVKDKRKERLSLETGEGRVQVSQEHAQSEMNYANDKNFSIEKIDADIVVELRDGRSPSGERGLTREASNAQTFQDMLSRELHNGLNTEIVRHASIVLRESGEGLIRLSLRPENLGNIKIRLEMADNKVTGKIILETDEALKAFEKEIASLEKSFVDSGFDGASLEMTLSSDHGNDGAGQQWRGEEARPFFSERFVSSRYEIPSDYDGMPESFRGKNLSLVDMLV